MAALFSSSQFREASRPTCRRLNSDTSSSLRWDVGKLIEFFFLP